MIGQYPILERSARNALARAVARARRMQQCITDPARLEVDLTTARVAVPPAPRGRQTDGQVDVARGTAPAPGGERVRAVKNAGLVAGWRSWS